MTTPTPEQFDAMLSHFARAAVYGGHLERVNAGNALKQAFMSSRTQALEEAAQIADGYVGACTDCIARDIRALASAT